MRQVKKTFYEINDRQAVYDFLSGTLCDALFSDQSFGYLNSYNKLLGGVRVRTQRHNIQDCPLEETEDFVTTRHEFKCYKSETVQAYGPSSTIAGFTNYEFKYSSASTLNCDAFGREWQYTTPYGTYSGGGFVKDIATNSTSTHAWMKAEFEALKTNSIETQFLDPTLSVTFVEFVTYQPILKTYMEFVIAFEMSVGGTIQPSIYIYPFKMSRFDNFTTDSGIVRLLLMIVTYLFVASFVYEEVGQIFSQNILLSLYGRSKGDETEVKSIPIIKRPFAYAFVKVVPIPLWAEYPFDPWEFLHVANICLNLTLLYYEISFFQESVVSSYAITDHITTYKNLHPVANRAYNVTYALRPMFLPPSYETP